VATQVWNGSRNKSGDLLVLLALADHADDQGKAWPGIPLLARKARLSERHTRRCLNRLVSSCEVEVLPNRAPSGRNLYQIQLDRLGTDNLSARASASRKMTPGSNKSDAADRVGDTTYIIEEPSSKPSEQSGLQMRISHSNPQNPLGKNPLKRTDSLGLISPPKNGF
jgi:hypothetical protein